MEEQQTERMSARKLRALRPGKVALICSKILPPLEGYRFFRFGVAGDGSCFFHSLCASINYMSYLEDDAEDGRRSRVVMEMRRKLWEDMMPKVWEAFTSVLAPAIRARLIDGARRSYASVRGNLIDPTFWADELLIRYVSWIMHLNVVFLDDVGGTMYCGVENMGGGEDVRLPTMVVAWVGRAHFEPIGVTTDDENTCVAEDGKTCVHGKFLFMPGKDDAVVDHIVQAYAAQCVT